jgi:hypothetical protein
MKASPQDIAAALASLRPKRSKYRNIKTTVEGIRFDSAKEARRYSELRLLEKAGDVTDLRRQTVYPLIVGHTSVGAYRADFDYLTHAGIVRVVEDVKSPATTTPVYRLKKKLMEALYGITITEV